MNMLNTYPNLRWISFRDVRRSAEGRHLVDFPQPLPLIALPYRLDIDHPLTPNFHDYCEVAYIVSGKGGCTIGPDASDLAPGDLVTVGPGVMHTFWSEPRHPVRFLGLYFLPEAVYAPGGSPVDREYLVPFIHQRTDFGRRPLKSGTYDEAGIRGRLEALVDGCEAGPGEDPAEQDLMLATILRGLLLELRRLSGKAKPECGAGREGMLERLGPAAALARRRLGDPVSLEEAASACAMSPWHFSRTFRAAVGSGFTEYRNRLRIDAAKELLRAGDEPITRVAAEAGFDNVNYFNRLFKRLVGMSPREYRSAPRDPGEAGRPALVPPGEAAGS